MRLSSSFAAGERRVEPRVSGSSHLAVAEEGPHPRLWLVSTMATVVQVAVEPGLVDRVDRTEAHGHGRELPEVGHQPRMRVARGQAAALVADLLAEAGRVPLSSSRPSRNARAYTPGARGPGSRPGRRWRAGSSLPRKKWLKPISYSGDRRCRRPPCWRAPPSRPRSNARRRGCGARCTRRRGTTARTRAGWC